DDLRAVLGPDARSAPSFARAVFALGAIAAGGVRLGPQPIAQVVAVLPASRHAAGDVESERFPLRNSIGELERERARAARFPTSPSAAAFPGGVAAFDALRSALVEFCPRPVFVIVAPVRHDARLAVLEPARPFALLASVLELPAPLDRA